ncbi:MAG: hypothetical protein HY875_16600 [Chloroflexi bacterium]|nr:hypothetical protein [Chloroflexota bacterium]
MAAGAVLAVAAGCGGDDGYGNPGGGTNTQAPATSTGGAASPGAVVKIGEVASVGKVLADASGLTLYTFNQDVANSGRSSCSGACATTWPPLLAPAGALTKPDGLTAELGVITRDDGGKQVTYGGRPLYRFAGDKAPGEAKGQGLNGLWFATPPQPAAASGTPAAGGYSY